VYISQADFILFPKNFKGGSAFWQCIISCHCRCRFLPGSPTLQPLGLRPAVAYAAPTRFKTSRRGAKTQGRSVNRLLSEVALFFFPLHFQKHHLLFPQFFINVSGNNFPRILFDIFDI